MTLSARARLAFLASGLACLIAIAAACGSKTPTEPAAATGAAGATIAGTVIGGQASSGLTGVQSVSGATPAATSPLAGLVVSVVGTNLSAGVGAAGTFEIVGVPAGKVTLKFTGGKVNAMTDIGSVTAGQHVELTFQVSETSAVVVNEERPQKISICHSEGNGSYHLIDISDSAESAHRAHGDARIGEPVPGQPGRMFDRDCRPVGPSVDIEKFTNGEDADSAPGPSIVIGSPVTWVYRVTNTGIVNLTGVTVTDDRGVAVNCVGLTSLVAGASMTCTGTGVATLGQYANIGTVSANWTVGALSGTVTDSDASHYMGVVVVAGDEGPEGPKVTLCHKTGNGSYHEINVSVNAEPAHRAHGDGKPGESVPGLPGKVFTASCGVQ